MQRALLVPAAVLAGAAACGGGRRPPEPPSARAPELVAFRPSCDGDRLKAFDPGIAGLAQIEVAQHAVPDAPLARTYERVCEITEDDDSCRARARRDVAAADPRAEIGDEEITGEQDGWAATLQVDGVQQSLRVATEREVLAEARRLQDSGHQVIPVEGHVVYRPAGRKAVVQYAVPVPGVAPPMRWELALRGPVPPELPAALDRLRASVERDELVLVTFSVEMEGLSAVVACP